MFSANYIPNTGGVEKYTQYLAFALAARGNRVIIVTNNVFDLAEHEVLAPDVEIMRLPCHKFLNGRLPLPQKNKAFRTCEAWLEKQAVDCVIVNTRFYPLSLMGIRFAEQKKVKPIVIDHGSAHLTLGNPLLDIFVSAYEHAITSRVKKHSADYYAVSSAGVVWLEHFDIKAQGILSNAIDAESFRELSAHRDFRDELGLSSEDFIVVFAGRFIPEKGIAALLEAAKLLKSHSTIHFILAGDGPLLKSIQQEALANIHLAGKLNAADISALFEAADAHCLPSRSEGFATTLLETAAWGTPSVVTEVGGVAELMPTEEYGLILNKADGKEIADALVKLFQNKELRASMGKQVRERVDSVFSWDETARKTEEACNRAN